MSTPLFYLRDTMITFGGEPLFSNISFQISQGEKICLVGRNGSGKSTLMDVILGKRELDAGERFVEPGVTIGHLSQRTLFTPEDTVRDFVLQGLPAEERDEANHYRVDIVLSPLELEPEKTMDTLSGGKLRRAALAAALIAEPNILLLDEPTNHLDLNAIEWLEDYLKHYRGGLICISHDRTFLNNISNKTLWLDRGGIKSTNQGYKHFEAWSDELVELEKRSLAKMGKKLEVENHWLTYGVTARRKRNQRRLGDLHSLRQKIRSDRAKYNTLSSTIQLAPLTPELGSKLVLEMKSVSKTLTAKPPSKRILKNFSIRVLRKERIGIIGRNGAGKSTLLKLIMKEITPDEGNLRLGKSLDITYFDQQRETLNPTDTVWETLCPGGGDTIHVNGQPRHIIGYLKHFLFDPKQAHSPISTLSGGECNRLLLARELANPGNLLILDEPTNDLDMDSLDVLQEILNDYQGTLIIVSHDRDFLDRLVERTIVMEGDGDVEVYAGGYSDYIEQKKEAAEKKKKKATTNTGNTLNTEINTPKALTKLSYKLQRELDMLPEKIEQLARTIKKREAELTDPDLYNDDPETFHTLSSSLQQAKSDLDYSEERWLELEEMRHGLDS